MKIIEILFIILSAIIGISVGYFIRKTIGEGKINNAEELAKRTIENSEREGEARKKELLLEAKEAIHKFRNDAERENRERRTEIQKFEKRILSKEETLDRKSDSIERKEELLAKKDRQVEEKES